MAEEMKSLPQRLAQGESINGNPTSRQYPWLARSGCLHGRSPARGEDDPLAEKEIYRIPTDGALGKKRSGRLLGRGVPQGRTALWEEGGKTELVTTVGGRPPGGEGVLGGMKGTGGGKAT